MSFSFLAVDNSSAYLSGAREQVAQLVAGISAPRKPASCSGGASSMSGGSDGNESTKTAVSATSSIHESVAERRHGRLDVRELRPALPTEKAQREMKSSKMPQPVE